MNNMAVQQELVTRSIDGFFINHLASMGPQKLASANLPFDPSVETGVSMRVVPLSSMLSNSREEVFLQTTNGKLMLIYTVNLPGKENKCTRCKVAVYLNGEFAPMLTSTFSESK